MTKFNYSNYDNTLESHEVIDITPQKKFLTTNKQTNFPVISRMPTISKINYSVTIIEKLLDTINNISNCITMISIEKQKTRQIEIQAQVQIEEFFQQTNRIKIQEEEYTKRFIAQCNTDLKQKEYELKKLCMTNKLKENKLKIKHKQYMEELNYLNKIVESLLNDKNKVIYPYILNKINDDDTQEKLLKEWNNINNNLIEISKAIVMLKKG